MIEKWFNSIPVPMAFMRKPAAHSNQNKPVPSACLRVNDGSARAMPPTGASPASTAKPYFSGRSRNTTAITGSTVTATSSPIAR